MLISARGAVKQQASMPSRSKTALGGQAGHLLAVLLLSAACCANALGASSPITACDRTADLQSLDVPVSELSANVVGHIVAEREDGEESLDVLPTQSDAAAPILNLAPRVADILQEVFSAVAIETPPLDSDEPTQSIAIEALSQDESPLSPVAGDAGQPEPGESGDPDSTIEDADAVPTFRRQMYRTDI